LVAGLIVTGIASAWAIVSVRNLQWQSAQEQEVELVMRAIEGGALKFAQLNSASLATQFLASHFSALSPSGAPRFLGAAITGGRLGSDEYASWLPSSETDGKCAKSFMRTVTPEGALYPYKITVVANDCWENPAITAVMRAAVTAPLVVSIGLLGVLGTALVAMMLSVRKADEILRRTPDSARVISLADKVAWEQVRVILKRAIETTGANLHYFQAIIEEAEHDVLREMTREAENGRHERMQIPVSAILRKLVLDSRVATRDDDQTVSGEAVELPLEILVSIFREHGLCPSFDNPADGIGSVRLPNLAALHRLALNLGSNVRKHGSGQQPTCRLAFAGDQLRIQVENGISLRSTLWFMIAAATGGIDTDNPKEPLVRRWLRREGIGSRVLKKATRSLGGKLSVQVRLRRFSVVILLPVQRICRRAELVSRRRAAAFVDKNLEDAARNAGLIDQLVSPLKLRELARSGNVDEVMVDFAIPEASESVVVRSVKSDARVAGVVKLWQGELI